MQQTQRVVSFASLSFRHQARARDKLSDNCIDEHKIEETFKQRSCIDHEMIPRREQDCLLHADGDMVYVRNNLLSSPLSLRQSRSPGGPRISHDLARFLNGPACKTMPAADRRSATLKNCSAAYGRT